MADDLHYGDWSPKTKLEVSHFEADDSSVTRFGVWKRGLAHKIADPDLAEQRMAIRSEKTGARSDYARN